MSRLLFAAARGARIECSNRFVRDWTVSCYAPTSGFTQSDLFHEQYRIHPDDVHLTYGPISMALRELATTKPDVPSILAGVYTASAYLDWCTPEDLRIVQTDKATSMFLLLVAEAISYEGL